MSRLIKLMIVAAAAVGMFAVSASAASAHVFEAAKYPVEVEALNTNFHGFQITGAVSVCERATFLGTEPFPTKATETLEVHPEYTECKVELAGTHTATVSTTGCNYVFHAAENKTPNGTVDVKCESGKEIDVHVEGIGTAENPCIIKVPGAPSNQELKAVEYINEKEGVDVEANITGIKWSVTAGCPLSIKEGTNGEYREGVINAKGEPELGTKAAKAFAEGFEPGTSNKIAIKVN